MNDDAQRQIDELESRIQKLESLVVQLLPDSMRIPFCDMPEIVEYESHAMDWDEYISEDDY